MHTTLGPRRTFLDQSHNGVEGTCPLAGTLRTQHCPVKVSRIGPQTNGREGGNNQRQLFVSTAISCSGTGSNCNPSRQDSCAGVGSARCTC